MSPRGREMFDSKWSSWLETELKPRPGTAFTGLTKDQPWHISIPALTLCMAPLLTYKTPHLLKQVASSLGSLPLPETHFPQRTEPAKSVCTWILAVPTSLLPVIVPWLDALCLLCYLLCLHFSVPLWKGSARKTNTRAVFPRLHCSHKRPRGAQYKFIWEEVKRWSSSNPYRHEEDI